METLKMHSLDGVQRNIDLIGELFPNAITEVKRNGKVEHAIDFDVLRQELSDSIVEVCLVLPFQRLVFVLFARTEHKIGRASCRERVCKQV